MLLDAFDIKQFPKGQIYCTELEDIPHDFMDLVFTYWDERGEFAVSCRIAKMECINGNPPKVYDALNQLMRWIGSLGK